MQEGNEWKIKLSDWKPSQEKPPFARITGLTSKELIRIRAAFKGCDQAFDLMSIKICKKITKELKERGQNGTN